MTTSEHLAWLLAMLAPPFTENYKAWAWARAKEIAADPEHVTLPQLLKEAMQPKSSASVAAGTRGGPSSTGGS